MFKFFKALFNARIGEFKEERERRWTDPSYGRQLGIGAIRYLRYTRAQQAKAQAQPQD